MIEWFKRLFHQHHWETIDSAGIRDKTGDRIGMYYVQQCKHCGRIRYQEFKA